MTTKLYEYGSDPSGLHFTISETLNGDGSTSFTVHVISGFLNLNALYWGNGDGVDDDMPGTDLINFTGAPGEAALSMSGDNTFWSNNGTSTEGPEVYDGGIKLSDVGSPATFLTAGGPDYSFTVPNLDLTNFEVLGVRATDTSFDNPLHTAGLVAKAPVSNNGQPLLVAEQLTDNGDPNPFYVQFTADANPFSFNATGDGPGTADTAFTGTSHDMAVGTETWVSATNATNGVAGDTIGKAELLTLRFFKENILPDVANNVERTDPTALADNVVLKFDGIGTSEDLIVILDLRDPLTNQEITRAVLVQNSDIFKVGQVPVQYQGDFTLDNNDGILVIESNDYIRAGEHYLVQGLQIMQSANGLTGTGINLNGAVGPNGGSANNGTQSFTDASFHTNDVLKITDIGVTQSNSSIKWVDTSPLVPSIDVDKVFLNVNGDPNQQADSAGDVINYEVTVTNTGSLPLTGVTVTDPLTGQNISGVTLAVGASQTYQTSYTITQADLDTQGGGDGDIDNTATAGSNETGEVQASASVEVPLAYEPNIAISKVFLNVNGNPGETANSAGDVINYEVVVTNTGNVTLTGITVTDPLTGQNISGVSLAPGEHATYDSSYAITQTDLDTQGGGDGDIDNTATATSDQTGPAQASASVAVPLDYSPSIGVEKVFLNVNGKDRKSTRLNSSHLGI